MLSRVQLPSAVLQDEIRNNIIMTIKFVLIQNYSNNSHTLFLSKFYTTLYCSLNTMLIKINNNNIVNINFMEVYPRPV